MAKNKSKAKRLIVVLLADTHCGHKLALLNPETPLVDEHGEPFTPGLNTTQRYLWGLYTQHIESVAELADGSPVLLIHNGDITQGTRYGHLSLVTINDQILGGIWNLIPWYEHKRINLAAVRVIVGTGVHGWEGSAEAMIAQSLAQRYTRLDTQAVYHASIDLKRQEQSIDCSHHGPFPGGRKWLEGNTPMYYLKSAMIGEMIDGKTPPIVYARAHYHKWLHVGPVRIRKNGKDAKSHIIISPSYSGSDDHVREATRSTPKIDLGLVAIEFNDGYKEAYPFYEEVDVRTHEGLDL